MDTIFGLIIISAILTPIFILSTLAIIDILKKLGFLKKKEESEERGIKKMII